ncbi:GNAT family N-acetyltransferase [Halomonas cerina]|uniref:Siderophore synthetase component/RimJ/RimL family protein N-acetyltransferase n=1 Tax=Halomonas cerina TaxID=447424 RepID=A0A839VEH6_9GAMM|nr:GNAT family N-acetyltransferase [Halomonas cerina]MBB3191759.1 siderophore synthetase component/RimJ/RimL family protein N-acetyltransferase [Halomonas cerina]
MNLFQPIPTTRITYRRHAQELGTFSLRPLHLPEDLARIHAWVAAPRAHFWGMQGHSPERVQAFYRDLQESDHAQGYLGLFDGEPAFLVECYDPRHDPIGEHYAVAEGDRGMHFLVAPAETPLPGFSAQVITTILAFMFEDSTTRRIVVEPDVNNRKIHPLNRRVGFVYEREVELEEKTAHLAFCDREAFASAVSAENPRLDPALAADPARAAAHLTPKFWARANRWLIRKAIAEFTHEKLLAPEGLNVETAVNADGHGDYRLAAPDEAAEYRFRARRLALDHWVIDLDSLEKRVDGAPAELDAQRFILEFRRPLGIGDEMLPVYLEEVASTLFGGAYKLADTRPDADGLVDADFQTLEAAMTEGHPVFVANNGRMGFDAVDYHAYAPEAAAPITLVWLAVHREDAHFSAIEGLDYAALLRDELGEATLADFHRRLEARGLEPADYLLMPAHPWQWFHKLAITFAAEVARGRIVCLGYGHDQYRAQQSIRTWFNVSQPSRRYVKTALSILNMGFMRGLSPHYMRATPAINDWIKALVDDDPELAAQGFTVLREEAAIGFRRDAIEPAFDRYSAYKKMLACLWRESPVRYQQDGQRLMTMAALLHVDADERALLPRLIQASGLATHDWLDRYLRVYFRPLLHCFYAYDLVFMPHGENLILQLEDGVPVRAIMKDIAEEIGIMNTEVALPEAVSRIAVEVPEPLKVLSIFTDVFDCFLRFMAPILVEQGDLSEQLFWERVARCVIDYQQDHPEFAEKFARHDLFAPEFTRSCLNRLQLNNHQQMIDLADPAKNLQFAGTLVNPIAAYRPETVANHATEEASA